MLINQALLGEVVRRVVEVAQPDRIVLFGSGARGRLGPDSDLDLLVIKSGVAHRRRLAQQIHLNFFGSAQESVRPPVWRAFCDRRLRGCWRLGFSQSTPSPLFAGLS